LTALQVLALVLVAGLGTAVVLTRDPLRQAVVNGSFGISLAVLFFVFQAPDVALSQIVIGGFALPAMILLTVLKVRERRLPEDDDE
jgi:energy-converting hydrogenase B subunit D